jgi:hypothetical protein
MNQIRSDWQGPLIPVLAVMMILIGLAWGMDVHSVAKELEEEEEAYRLPVLLQTIYNTGDSQEMRFISSWTKAWERCKLARPGSKEEPHLWVVATITWDPEVERLAVMIESMFMFPQFGGLAFKTHSSLHILEARAIGDKQHHDEQIERILDVTQQWMRLAIPIFEAIVQSQQCDHRSVFEARG